MVIRKKIVLLTAFTACTVCMTAADILGEADSVSTRNVFMRDIIIAADPKTNATLEEQPLSFSKIDNKSMEALGVKSLKNVAAFVPNLFMPDYGSRLTSAIYIRGIGSRINTPAVGLYVDDCPYLDKSAFDTGFLGVERVEVLRGPQSTLYGRNTMGGLIKVYTRDPRVGGTEVKLGGSTRDAGRYAQFLTSKAVSQMTGYSLGAFYSASDGYNRNAFLNRRSNGGESAGGRFRWLYDNSADKDSHTLKADFMTSLEYSDEDGYDYYYTGKGDDDTYAPYKGRIVCGELGGYSRTLLNASLKLETRQPLFTLTSVTSYQFIRDHMFMDQDFSPLTTFTISQRQRSHSLTEEVVLKSDNGRKSTLYADWTAGAFLACQSLNTKAPVVFGQDGIASLIQSNIDKGLAAANAAVGPRGMNMALTVQDESMPVYGDFDTPVLNAAAFGQLTLRNVAVEGLDLTAGLRLDYEHTRMEYESGAETNFKFLMTRTVGGMAIPLYNYDLTAETRYKGTIRKDYTQLLPKLALTYNLGSGGIVYASVSKGFRSGGYNIQMFSDLVQTSLKNDMMSALAEKLPMVNSFVSIGQNPSADSTTVFKPEKSWNYELGTHLSLIGGKLRTSAAVFFIDTREQQVARYADNGLGRKMVNAGHSQSYGLDLSLAADFTLWRNPLTLSASYGYTHATFRDYDGGTNGGESHVYDGNYVPFAPLHTFAAAAEYRVMLKEMGLLKSLSLGLNLSGAGRIYWTEDNSASQPLYALLGAHVSADFGLLTVNMWGKNLTSTDYTPFYFESMGKGFAQTCRPLQLGVDVSLRF